MGRRLDIINRDGGDQPLVPGLQRVVTLPDRGHDLIPLAFDTDANGSDLIWEFAVVQNFDDSFLDFDPLASIQWIDAEFGDHGTHLAISALDWRAAYDQLATAMPTRFFSNERVILRQFPEES
jgi:hypothetical protein